MKLLLFILGIAAPWLSIAAPLSLTDPALPKSVASGYSAPFAYYKLDENPAGLIATDSVSGYNIGKISGSTAVQVSGKISNAWDINLSKYGVTNAVFDFTAKDFCIRFWCKWSSAATSAELWNRWDNSNGWDVELVGNLGTTKLDFNVTAGGVNTDIRSGNLSTNTFHHCVVWCRHGTEIGLVVDNGTPVTASISEEIDFASIARDYSMALGLCTYHVQIDEAAFWKDYVLSGTDLLADYNGGLGVTYPLSP